MLRPTYQAATPPFEELQPLQPERDEELYAALAAKGPSPPVKIRGKRAGSSHE